MYSKIVKAIEREDLINERNSSLGWVSKNSGEVRFWKNILFHELGSIKTWLSSVIDHAHTFLSGYIISSSSIVTSFIKKFILSTLERITVYLVKYYRFFFLFCSLGGD